MKRKFEGNTLVIATHNLGKLEEFKAFLSDYAPIIKSAADYELDAPEENGHSFRENALIKARYVAMHTGKIALADDSGLVIPVLGGKPGIRSAEWTKGKNGQQGAFDRIKEEILATGWGDKPVAAAFHVALCLYWPDGRHEFIEAHCDGHISYPPRGKFGHGYDPIFVPKGKDKTFAEINLDEKQEISHRGKAMRALVKAYFQ